MKQIRRFINKHLTYFTTLAVTLGLGLILGIGFASYLSMKRISEQTTERARLRQNVVQLERLLSALKDVETSQRGYLLTTDPSYLEPMQVALSDIDRLTQSLDKALYHSKTQKQTFDELKVYIQRKIEISVLSVENRMESEASTTSKMLSGEGKLVMDRIRDLTEDLMAKEFMLLQTKSAQADASLRWGSYVSVLGSILAFIIAFITSTAVIRDIRRRKKVESELREAQLVAIQASQAKSQFLANMSHEIRTPLNAIVGMADLLAESPLNDEQRKYLRIFQKAGNTLTHLLNDILDLAKIEAGKFELWEAPFHLVEALNSSIEVMRFRASQKGLELRLETGDELPDYVIGDVNRLRQVLHNLLSNAIKFTSAGSVILKVERVSQQNFLFSVKDTGIGISETKASKIFQQFEQTDVKIASEYGGTGLGLSISKQLVEMFGGQIWFESDLGQGTTFYFEVPFTTADAPLEAEFNLVSNTTRSLQILVVDDSSDNRLLLSTLLKKSAAVIEEAENGAQAVQKIQQKTYDIVFMDVHMPVMDGLTATQAVRSWERTQNRKSSFIVALTAYAYPEDVKRCLDAGCDLHLAKPIKKDALLKLVAEISSGQMRTTYDLTNIDS